MDEQFDPQDVAENKVLALVSCLGLLLLVGVFAKPDSKLVKYYVNQTLLLMITVIVVGAGSFVLSIIFGFLAVLVPIFAIFIVLLVFVVWAVNIAVFVATIMNMITAYGGQKSKIPFFKDKAIWK